MADEKKKVIEAGDAEASLPVRRVGPVEFFQQVRREAKKVTWPSWKETWLTSVMVFIMVGLMMVFMEITELVLGYGEALLVGAKRLF